MVDDYAGYKSLFQKGVGELTCLAHCRRKFFDLHAAAESPVRMANRSAIKDGYQKEQLGQNVRDSFGNLALLSPGVNSSYSNQDSEKKRVDFDRKPNYDALKLAHIFHLISRLNLST